MTQPHWRPAPTNKDKPHQIKEWQLIGDGVFRSFSGSPFTHPMRVATLWRTMVKGTAHWTYRMADGKTEPLPDNLKPREAKIAVETLWRMK